MKHFKLYNNIVGWFAFAVAAVTYLLTIEPTASFWDCGEFIASASKLEVGHPPGAPLFIMMGRIFGLFASDATQIAAMVNRMSALLSAFSILFLFWTITHIARRIVVGYDGEMSVGQGIAILGSGLVGALAYTFSDTFWFSAVEGEVYAFSSFFTAVVFWCILKWEDVASEPRSARWFVLIAYLMGLSIGVHLLNLLAIPAIVLVYYFKKYQPTTRGVIAAVAVSVVILGAVLYGVIPGFVKVASWFELLCVNVFGMSFNSGVLVYLVITAAIFCWSLYETHTERSPLRSKISFIMATIMLGVPFLGSSVIVGILIIAALVALFFVVKKWNLAVLNLVLLCMMVLLIGYSTYAMIVIRSMANTPMDQNSPEDVFSLQSYLNREQYGDRPLIYGPMYSAPEILEVRGNQCFPVPVYGGDHWQLQVKESPDEKDHYINVGKKQKGYEMDSRFKMLFPRMYSAQPSHVTAYKSWGNVKGRKIQVDRCGRPETLVMPTMGENLRFFFSYQVNYMYWRYFMWNFSGRQNDMQGHGELDKGNWISGIPFIDNARLGDQSKLPDSYKANRGHNVYYMLPLLLGLLGIAWQLVTGRRGKQNFWVVFTFFFLTGLAIVVYLNQTPYQPRERDYAYAGSFYAFSIWIGLGVMFLYSLAERFIPKPLAAALVSAAALIVPVQMASQNWDDHDRSNRRVARDFGLNYLNSCDDNAIIFSNGDNDTFPLWYNLEVEENRDDMRVCNLSYLNTDWYIDQMKRGAYKSDPLPISWSKKDYRAGNLEAARVMDHPQVGGSLTIEQAFQFLRDPRFIDEDGIGNIFSSTLTLPVDKAKAIATGTVPAEDSALIVPQMEVKLGRSINKAQMMVLEMLSTNNWERPMYICATVGEEYYPALKDYMQLEGLAYRIVPIKGKRDRVNSAKMYDNMMHRFEWGNINNPDVYLDEQHMRMTRTIRLLFSQLSEALYYEGDTVRALEVIHKCFEVTPPEIIPHDYSSTVMAALLYRMNHNAEADAIIESVYNECLQKINYVLSLPARDRGNVSYDCNLRQQVGLIQNMWMNVRSYESSLADKLQASLEQYYPMVSD